MSLIVKTKNVSLLFSILVLLAWFFVAENHSAYATPINEVEMAIIPEGYFLMGSKQGEGRADERPQRKVYLDTYSIDVEEVSNK